MEIKRHLYNMKQRNMKVLFYILINNLYRPNKLSIKPDITIIDNYIMVMIVIIYLSGSHLYCKCPDISQNS